MRRLWDREAARRLVGAPDGDAGGDGRRARDRREHLARRWTGSTRAERGDDGRRLPLPGHAVRGEDRPAPDGPRPAHRRTEERDSRRRWRSSRPADARILRPVDDTPSYEIFHDVLAQPAARLAGALPCGAPAAPRAALGMLAAAAAAIVLGLAAYILEPAWLERRSWRRSTRASRSAGTCRATPDIVIVDLDDASLAALGGGADRIPRRLHARMIDRCARPARPVIAYDFEFREPTPADASLRAAIERAGRSSLLAATQIDSEARARSSARPGDGAVGERRVRGLPDRAGRRVPPGGRVGRPVRGRALRGADEPAARASPSPPRTGRRPAGALRARLDRLPGPAGTYPAYAFADVLRGADPGRFEDKIVVVGTSARRQGDLHPTAHGGGRVMSGAEIQANAIATLRRGTAAARRPTAVDARARSSCSAWCRRCSRSPRVRRRRRAARGRGDRVTSPSRAGAVRRGLDRAGRATRCSPWSVGRRLRRWRDRAAVRRARFCVGGRACGDPRPTSALRTRSRYSAAGRPRPSRAEVARRRDRARSPSGRARRSPAS